AMPPRRSCAPRKSQIPSRQIPRNSGSYQMRNAATVRNFRRANPLEFGGWDLELPAPLARAGWPTGLEPATARTTIWSSTIELWPPSAPATVGFEPLIAKKSAQIRGTFSAIFAKLVDASVATRHGPAILCRRALMKKIGSFFLAGLLFLAAPSALFSQTDDPSELFLKAYMTAQQGEKLEHESQFKAALAKYRFAGSLLEELREKHGDWQPTIVDYR